MVPPHPEPPAERPPRVQARELAAPGDEHLVATSLDPDVDLIVVGARGLGPLGRALLGSVSERVLRHAGSPVLVVKHDAR
ncbi:MAG TPA: universal stress protein [Candidatus Tectomicrobia bacterium]|nr:universal stress protein [Candidatus Tectomicrobia bacterium]